ncbi:MAG: HlyD family type I secretion periplasmic adaptor subunit [Burkholderiales bacterium]|nr:HlyD family type I secretion periplasmic adaptor subunit [Burkholderiales bacterium]
MPARKRDAPVVDFLPDADEIERRPLPWLARVTLYALAAMLVAFVGWAALAEIDRVVVARGRLVTPLPNIVVQPLETSIIRTLDVRVGQVVKAGQALATLDPTFAQADQAQLEARVRSLQTQSSRLAAELGGDGRDGAKGSDADSRLQSRLAGEREAAFAAQMRRHEETIGRLRAAQATNRRDQQLLAARVQSLREIETMQSKLVDQQFSSKVKLLEAQEKRLEVERDQQLAINREAELARELAATEAEKAAFERNWRQKAMEEMLSTSRDKASLDEQLQKAVRRREFVTLTAPADAVVLDIARLSQGSVVREAEPMFTLVPLAPVLEAEVQIDSIDVGYVRHGDPVRLKLDAFPFQRHGAIDATVRTVSEDAFRRDAGGNTSTLDPGTDAFFLSRVDLRSTTLERMPAQSRLLPGMTLTAEIVVGKRTVLSYLLWPLTRAMDGAIREP